MATGSMDTWQHDEELDDGDIEASDTRIQGDVTRGSIDVVLLLAVAVLVGIGTLAVYIGSSWRAELRFGTDMTWVNQHLQGVVIGCVALVVANRLDFRWYRDFTRLILLVTVLLLFLTLVPGIGVELNGAKRWLDLRVILFQPAELAKVSVCIFMAYSMEKRREQIQDFSTFWRHDVALMFLLIPLILQPDFGSSVILTAIVGCMLFIGGARWLHFVSTGLCFGFLGMAAIFSEGYRIARMRTWFNPWDDMESSSWQLINAWVAMARGGLKGTGFGEGFSMFGFVPEMHNDFVAAVIAEEFGWIGFVVFVALFGIVAWRGYRIARQCDDVFGAYLAFALTTLITGQAMFNLGVVTGVMPTKGLTLPFVSFGRSSLIILLFVVGILLNISQNNPDVRRARQQLKQSGLAMLTQRQQYQRWRDARMKDMRTHTGRNDE